MNGGSIGNGGMNGCVGGNITPAGGGTRLANGFAVADGNGTRNVRMEKFSKKNFSPCGILFGGTPGIGLASGIAGFGALTFASF